MSFRDEIEGFSRVRFLDVIPLLGLVGAKLNGINVVTETPRMKRPRNYLCFQQLNAFSPFHGRRIGLEPGFPFRPCLCAQPSTCSAVVARKTLISGLDRSFALILHDE